MTRTRTKATRPSEGNKMSSLLKASSDSKKKSNRAQQDTTQLRKSVTKAYNQNRKARSPNSATKRAYQTQRLKPYSLPRLPPCPGPKLEVFKNHEFKIQWLERLDEDDDEHKEGHVLRAKIGSRQYALKVFKDYDVDSERFYWETYLNPEHDPQEVAYYIDPFYNECRAYGRIRDALQEQTLHEDPAMPCYGYILLSDEDEDTLTRRGLHFRLNDDDDDPVHTVQKPPIRAIVKKLGSSAPGVTLRRQSKICNALRQLRRHRIYNRDIRAENYRDGLLVDFGYSITEPHIIFDEFDEDAKSNVRGECVGLYKGMLDINHIKLIHDPMVSLEPNVTTRSRAAQKGGRTRIKENIGKGARTDEIAVKRKGRIEKRSIA